MKPRKNRYLGGTPIATAPITGDIGVVALVDRHFQAYNLQITDARPDTGDLSGATPSEAVGWGKVDPDRLTETVVAYLDSTIAMPVIVSYALPERRPGKLRRLFDRRVELVESLRREYGGAQNKEHSHHKPKEGYR
jgi:deoxyhypusine synthase